jgi:hypothetical protein
MREINQQKATLMLNSSLLEWGYLESFVHSGCSSSQDSRKGNWIKVRKKEEVKGIRKFSDRYNSAPFRAVWKKIR